MKTKNKDKEKEKIQELLDRLERINATGLYDVEKYWISMMHQTSQIEYFYCDLVKGKNRDIDSTFYPVYHKPREHFLAYFNIGRGFPKELHDGHYCYILNDLGYKALVIPTTSIKENSSKENPDFEKDIEIVKNHHKTFSRLQLSDIRSVDFQRLDTRKAYLQVLTDRDEINEFVKERLFDRKK